MRSNPAFLATRACIAAIALLFARVAYGQDDPAEVEHVWVVAHGQSLSSIAHELAVTPRALAERNHLSPPYPLRIGRRLRLPDGVDPAVARRLPTRPLPASPHAGRRSSSFGTRVAASSGRQSWGRPRLRGVVHFIRESDDETLTVNLRHPSHVVQRRMQHFLRFGDGRSHAMHARLLRQLAIVSDHFGGRRVHVISGFRPFRRGQWTPHSNHNIGNAVDFRVEGVPNRTLRDYCRTLPRTGCGFYPRSVFVHMDIRPESATWVDWSRPGQRPMYGREDRPPESNDRANVRSAPAPESRVSDESMDDVAADSPRVLNAPPATDEPSASEPTGDTAHSAPNAGTSHASAEPDHASGAP